ncbi:Ku protein (plasmid) [Cytobacillus spongiae]|uniref:non-homologous end joining protein Ku n=1 Tax=Cytobacillus spongiae TaxID=2901381 RepID=UPI00145F22AA|nr:Ku protein [Cytobacillus spongiae]MCA1063003.1 Ku protein [Rossellomorea aquimaris]NMH70336.1 Ku protein [Bacillus sp. RO3]UII58603.1 Ku protein [Cytobacillus spongiae]WJV28374.1 Ku protein [Rossellomorea sp. AcN35-11]
MHTIWKGSISFGLVNIPIKLHSATEDRDIKLRSLHKECHTPIKYEKVCPACEKEIDHHDIVKGYEVTKGKFVVLQEEELKELKEENGDKAVEIVDFIKMEEIDPIFFERTYYVSPNDGGKKAYSLLRKALQESGKVGIAKITMRSKEQLSIVRVYENTLVMETIHYPDEVRGTGDVPNVPEEDEITDKELETATMLIEQLTTDFQPQKYKDLYRERLSQLIESKQTGEKIVTAKEKEPKENVTDLMAALQASIDSSKPNKAKTTKKKATSKKKAQ